MINEMKQYNYIYLITNQVNNKIYVGKHHTDNLDDGYMGSGKLIKKAIQKYGIENFTKEYLAFCDTEEKLNWLEKFYIKKYKAREAGYNLTDGGDGTIGYKHTQENKIKISEAGKGRIKSEVECKKLSESKRGEKNPMFGTNGFWVNKHLPDETKQKISNTLKGNIPWNKYEKGCYSDDTIQKMRESHKGKTPWNKGLKGSISDETRKKMSESAKNRKSHKK